MNLYIKKTRLSIRAAVLAGFVMAALWGLPVSNCSIKIGHLRLVFPTGFVENSLLSHGVRMELVPGMMIIGLLLLLFGRFYCSWICSASSVHQLAEPVLYRPIVGRRVPWLKRFFLTPCEGVSKKLNLGYGDGLAIFLGLVAGVALFDFPFFTIFSPMGLVSRNVIELAVHKRLRYDLLLLAGPLLVGLFFRHGWKTCCPDGLMQRFVASWNKTLLPEVDPTACNGCAKCRRTCPAGLLAEDTVRLAGDCLKCLQCIEICPNHAVHLRLFPRKTRTPIPSKLSPGRRV